MEPEDKLSDAPVDRLIIQLRAYVEGPRKRNWDSTLTWASGITIIFDTETMTDPSQRLRFGAYQLRDRGELLERGVFHAEDLADADLEVLRTTFAEEEPSETGERLVVSSKAEFIERIIYGWGLEVGGLIIGFNLPFDLSRIATKHTYAKGSMKGGFSFTLAKGRPNLVVKHLSQRAAFIRFAGKDGGDKDPDRGFFVDVKTLAATLTSGSHSLQSLTKLLGTTPKSPLDSYDGPLTPEMVRYGLNDVQATWECFAKLAERYDSYGLQTGIHELYSEASLGKAFLRAMNIRPWQRVQPKFPPKLIGQIMSTYYGGRAEVHIRREITPVIHCDFMSMYPTVCTLMGLWRFVIASGVEWREATRNVRRLVDNCSLADLQNPRTWGHLLAIVQVRPNDDIFPVRAVYEPGQAATIGVNHLHNEPMWFTLADVVAAKILGGKAPEIVSAIEFTPLRPQPGLRAITLEGTKIDPEADDFYKELIKRRQRVQLEEETASEEDKPALASVQQSLKILTNSTSYGIFVELNVEHLDKPRSSICYDFRGEGRPIKLLRRERTGRYFHPLLATLITGAARLMLSLAERNTVDRGLDWAFCDTDSLALANTSGLPITEFVPRAEAVRAWFAPLNPYGIKPGPILQLEKVSFPVGQDGVMDQLRPTNCLAISAKRYVLFDRDKDGSPLIRKASAHGLGHLLPPYPDPDRAARIRRIGVESWEEDLWTAIIAAFDGGHPDEVDLTSICNFGEPAASRYAATNQELFGWFKDYNKAVDERDQVWPFNFLLSFQAKSRMEMAASEPGALWQPAWRRREPHPASRYSSDLVNDQPPVFDRKRPENIVPWHWLKSYGRSLVRHHLHPEMKFLGGSNEERGVLRRRHVKAWAIIPIGKEADNLEEREVLGEDEETIEWSMAGQDRRKLAADIEETLKTYRLSDAALLRRANVSHHTLAALRRGGRVTQHSLLKLARAAEELRREHETARSDQQRWRQVASAIAVDVGGRNRLARLLGLSASYVGRLLRGERPISSSVAAQLADLQNTVCNWTNDVREDVSNDHNTEKRLDNLDSEENEKILCSARNKFIVDKSW